MRAIYYENFGGPEVLKLGEFADPEPGPGEVLLRVQAAGVNPCDWKMREGILSGYFDIEFPVIPGFDVAGLVLAVGPNVVSMNSGDRVFGYVCGDKVHYGSYAELCVASESQLAKIPAGLSFEEAACLPIPTLTVWQSLFSSTGVAPGQNVLIHAGAGGVGSFAVQAACHFGARVCSTSSEANRNYVMGLGAQQVFDYRSAGLWQDLRRAAPNGYDMVLDSVGGDTLEHSYGLVREDGVLIALNQPPSLAICEARHIRCQHLIARPDGAQLAKIGQLVSEKAILMPPIKIMAMQDAVEALKLSQSGHMRGKIVLKSE